MTDININVPILARVEGEGALSIAIKNGEIETLNLSIYEPPRFFEKFLEGRRYDEVLDIVARICGICPVAYQMSAVQALEQIFQCTPNAWVRDMRRAFYCGEWLESHGLHVHMLAAPDFLGYGSAIEMAKDYPDEVKRGLRLHAIGNEILSLFGGRAVHPVGACVGGFYSAPSLKAVSDMLKKIECSMQDAEDLIAWTASLPMVERNQNFPSICIKHAREYPMNEGNIFSDTPALDLPKEHFDKHFKEEHVAHSTALHCLMDGTPYMLGPLSRINNCLYQLPENIQKLIAQTGIQFPSKNTFHSIVARAIEIYYALQEARRIFSDYSLPDESRSEFEVQSGIGYGCTEAPRGMLWHRYEVDEKGFITSSTIIPPTSQNQARIESDLMQSLHDFGLDKDQDAMRLHSEMVVRNYDPCISCSTHFLTLNVEKKP